jgi:hypothetical protein
MMSKGYLGLGIEEVIEVTCTCALVSGEHVEESSSARGF